MAQTAFQTQYRQEYIAGFEQGQSLLRQSTTTEAVIKGNTAVFLVADSGGASAVTRGVNGRISPRVDNLNQNSCILVEWHDLPQRTGFNIFASQGDGKRIMQETSLKVLNRRIDADIINELANGTRIVNSNTAVATPELVYAGLVGLQNNAVPWDGNITLLCTPSFLMNLMKYPEFSKMTYAGDTPLKTGDGLWSDKPNAFRHYLGFVIIVHPNLTGIGTDNAKCYMYHRSAIGHAMDTTGMNIAAGYHEEQDYYWSRASGYMGAKLLQNNGVVTFNHKDTSFSLDV